MTVGRELGWLAGAFAPLVHKAPRRIDAPGVDIQELIPRSCRLRSKQGPAEGKGRERSARAGSGRAVRLRRRRGRGGSSAGVTSGGSQLRNVPRRTLCRVFQDGLEAAAKGGDVKMADAALRREPERRSAGTPAPVSSRLG